MDRETLAAGLNGTSAELREQLTLMMASAQLLDRTADQRQKNYLSTMYRSMHRMLRILNRLELAHKLTDENEIRSFPDLMDLGPWAEDLARRVQSALELAGYSLEWTAPAHLLAKGDESLLTKMLLEMVSAVAQGGRDMKLTVTGQKDKAQIMVSASGEIPTQILSPAGIGEDDPGIDMIRLIAQLHGGTLVTCTEGGACKSLTAVVPLRMDLPGQSRLASPKMPREGGLDPVVVALSHLLP